MKFTWSGIFKKIFQLIEVEQHVGSLWHVLLTPTKIKHYPEARVHFDEIRHRVGVMFRALGGDAGLRIESAPAKKYKMSRTLLQRITASTLEFEFAWRNEYMLSMPFCIDVFSEKSLNYDLYLWLAALASGARNFKQLDKNRTLNWAKTNQCLSYTVLKHFPGLLKPYQRLVTAQLVLRPKLQTLSDDEARLEQIIQQVLQNPGQVAVLLKDQSYLPQAVYLWLYPSPPQPGKVDHSQDDETNPEGSGETLEPEQQYCYQAEKVDTPDGNSGLVLDRFENIFSWAEYIKVDRCTDEDEDLTSAEESAKDLEYLSITRDNKTTAKRIRFDLDLPPTENINTSLGEGILLPEWDYRIAKLVKDNCCLQAMTTNSTEAIELPSRLRNTAKKLRSQFKTMKYTRIWYRGQQQGSEVDLDAYLDFVIKQKQSNITLSAEPGLYREFRSGFRDMACLLLADLSLSTDSWLNDDIRVIDAIRDSLFLFAEALSASADQFAMYGFSSRYRAHIRFHTLKTFNESYNALIRGRINAIKPGFYTRMGAAIRHASEILSNQSASQQLLLFITDGKPNDLDLYDGRYGIEDTRRALIEARRKGLHPFCVTIDQKAGDYLPHMFGPDNYIVIRKPAELPRELPLLYARLSY